MPSVRRREVDFEDHVERLGTTHSRRTVSVDPAWLNDYLDGRSFQEWDEEQNNETPWYLSETETD